MTPLLKHSDIKDVTDGAIEVIIKLLNKVKALNKQRARLDTDKVIVALPLQIIKTPY